MCQLILAEKFLALTYCGALNRHSQEPVRPLVAEVSEATQEYSLGSELLSSSCDVFSRVAAKSNIK
jgi:hypothetical protein